MARKYYMLYTLEQGKWGPQFGDYQRPTVQAEMEDYHESYTWFDAQGVAHNGMPMMRMKIVTLDSDTQEAIDLKTGELNSANNR